MLYSLWYQYGADPSQKGAGTMPSDLDDQIIALFATLSDNEKREFIRLFSAFPAAVEEQASQTSSQDQPGVTGP